MSGRVGDLSDKQATALSQLKENVSDILLPHHDDHYLLRFLRARNFDLKKTEAMLRRDKEWRVEVGADVILDTFTVPEVLARYFPGGTCGQDKEGSVIWVAPAGTIDCRGLLRSVRKQDLMKYNVHLMESLYQQFSKLSTQQKRRVDQLTLVFDFEHFGLKHLWKPGVDMFTDLVTVSEDHYPETLKTCFIINAPKIFPIAFNLVKPFLTEATVRKIHIIGGSYQDTLLRHIDADQLPKHWGGTMTDPDGDPFCASRVCMGGDVPERFWCQQRQDLSGFTQASVGRGSSLHVDLSVTRPGTVLRWQFQTDGNDIGFGVFRKRNEGGGGGGQRQKAGQMEAVLTSLRVNSHMVPEDGSLTCPLPGTYVVRFDNTYSWTRSKKLYYLIEMLEPDNDS